MGGGGAGRNITLSWGGGVWKHAILKFLFPRSVHLALGVGGGDPRVLFPQSETLVMSRFLHMQVQATCTIAIEAGYT